MDNRRYRRPANEIVYIGDDRVTIFSAPRKFDTATILVVTICYAILFGFLLGIGVPKLEVCAVAIFITIVGVCQPILFGGKMPRLASVIGGVIGGVAALILLNLTSIENIAYGVVPVGVLGGAGGYLAGALVGGVFLVIHYIRVYFKS